MNSDEILKYKDLLLNCIKGEDCIEAFYEYKNKLIPNKVFRYRTCSKKNLETLKNNQLYLCAPIQFNDIYDCTINNNQLLCNINTVFNEKNIIMTHKDLILIDELLWEIANELSKHDFNSLISNNMKYNEVKKKLELYFEDKNSIYDSLKTVTTEKYYKQYYNINKPAKIKCLIVCFSEAYDNILMWSHYADYNKGYCLEYDTRDIQKRHLFPVLYEDTPANYSEFLEKCEDKNNILYIKVLQAIYACSKFTDWSYEKEWRYFGNTENLLIKPTAIYIGVNISKKNKKIIYKYARKNKILVKEMIQIPGQYKLKEKNTFL